VCDQLTKIVMHGGFHHTGLDTEVSVRSTHEHRAVLVDLSSTTFCSGVATDFARTHAVLRLLNHRLRSWLSLGDRLSNGLRNRQRDHSGLFHKCDQNGGTTRIMWQKRIDCMINTGHGWNNDDWVIAC
jgi:hypothetical protein